MKPAFTFIDLFAGIGGMRIGFEDAGGRCLFSSEWDRFAADTYEANFGERPAGDIRAIDSGQIPAHDVLVAGFPCQPFSISGVSKKTSLGKPHGFLDETQGTLFFEICRIIKDKQPRAVVLENVKNLKHHDKGKTFEVILAALKGLQYEVHAQVINARGLVPQNRERMFIVAFREPTTFSFPVPTETGVVLRDILEPDPDSRYTLSTHLWTYLRQYAKKHKAAGNGFGFGLAPLNGTTRTLSARYFKDGSEILVPRGKGRNPRRLTPRECARLMGFPDSFRIRVSDTQAYKQFGNSVAVPLVKLVAQAVAASLSLAPTSALPRAI